MRSVSTTRTKFFSHKVTLLCFVRNQFIRAFDYESFFSLTLISLDLPLTLTSFPAPDQFYNWDFYWTSSHVSIVQTDRGVILLSLSPMIYYTLYEDPRFLTIWLNFQFSPSSPCQPTSYLTFLPSCTLILCLPKHKPCDFNASSHSSSSHFISSSDVPIRTVLLYYLQKTFIEALAPRYAKYECPKPKVKESGPPF